MVLHYNDILYDLISCYVILCDAMLYLRHGGSAACPSPPGVPLRSRAAPAASLSAPAKIMMTMMIVMTIILMLNIILAVTVIVLVIIATYARHRLNGYLAQRVSSLSLASSLRNHFSCAVLKCIFPWRARYPLRPNSLLTLPLLALLDSNFPGDSLWT